MDKPIVACIQQRLIVPKTADDYPAYLNRFLRTAKAKGAVLAVFPELSGLATSVATFSGWRNELLKTAGQGQHPRAGFWDRTKAKVASGAASIAQADLRKSLVSAVGTMPEALREAYVGVFAGLARHYEITIVAGTVYEVDGDTGIVHNVAYVFGPDGAVLGKQAKVMVARRETSLAQPAEGWGIIPTPAGRLGILIGGDTLYPEPSRILAYQGADMLVALAAVNQPATYHKIRQAAHARCQENQLYGLVSFLTGPDPFAQAEVAPFVGASAIFAPADFTPRFSGVMVEVGSPLAEAVITAEWDYGALVELWEQSDTPLRRDMPMRQTGAILANVYASGVPLAEAERLMLTGPAKPALEDAAADTGMAIDAGGVIHEEVVGVFAGAAEAVSPEDAEAVSLGDATPPAVADLPDSEAIVMEPLKTPPAIPAAASIIEAPPTATVEPGGAADAAPPSVVPGDETAADSAGDVALPAAEERRFRFPWQK